jgi:hypothetical protein
LPFEEVNFILEIDAQGETVQSKFKALDSVVNIPNKKKFENYGRLDEKRKAAKARKDEKEKN